MSITTDQETMEREPIRFDGQMEDGIYFGLPEDQYHAAPALSNSGIKWLKVSPLDFYMRSWMNPEYQPEESKFMTEGSAWHKRVLEGREAFYGAYAAALDPADHPDALKSQDDLKEACKLLGLKVGGSKNDLTARLIENGFQGPIWSDLLAEHGRQNVGKTLLPFDLIARVEKQAAMIERHPDISRCFSGGYPEVSIFWTDEEAGVPMKARLDYLKFLAIVDLKTHSNPLGKSQERAAYNAISSGRYHIQTAVYWTAVEHAVEHVKAGRIFGDADRDWCKRFADADPSQRQFVFVLQQTGLAPVARAFVMPRMSVFDIGKMEMRAGMQTFANCWRTFGTDPWIDLTPITTLDDAGFPAWLSDA